MRAPPLRRWCSTHRLGHAIVLLMVVTSAVVWSATLPTQPPPIAHANQPIWCEQGTIFGIGPQGIYEIKTRTGSIVKRWSIPGVTIAAGHSPVSLYFTNAAGNLYHFAMLTGVVTPVTNGTPLPHVPNALGNVWTFSLYSGAPIGGTYHHVFGNAFALWGVGGNIFVGAGTPFSGDLARNPCYWQWPAPPPQAHKTTPSIGGIAGSALETFDLTTAATVGALGDFYRVGGAATPIAGPMEGLAWTQSCQLYASEDRIGFDPLTKSKVYWVRDQQPGQSVEIAGHDDQIVDLASEPVGYCTDYQPPPEPSWGDLGDAPDDSNNKGQPMTAYGGAVAAKFPTTHYAAQFEPSGPKHAAGSTGILGADVSEEKEADTGPDNDGHWNIDPYTDTPDLDGADDALQSNISLPHCQLTDFDVDVTIHADPQQARYLNVWFDYNRDGDWADTLTCIDPQTQQQVSVSEHAIDDLAVVQPLGTHTVNTSQFRAYDHLLGGSIWVRLTLTSAATISPDGRGLLYPMLYSEGETEDYSLEHYSGDEYAP